MIPRDVVIDTQLLVLLVVGLTSVDYVARHKRLRAYTRADLDLLAHAIRGPRRLLVTSGVLAETSNLLRQVNEPALTRIMSAFRKLIGRADEHHVAARQSSERPEFVRLGLTDTGLLDADDDGSVLLTDDGKLYTAAQDAGRRAVNFNHLRMGQQW